MVTKKSIGIILLIIAITFLDFTIGPTDFVTLQVYSAVTGEDISLGNISSIYLDYTIWGFMVGGVLLILALWLIGWNRKTILRKLNLGKYKIAVLLSFVVVIVMTFMELDNYCFLLILPILYYFYEKDISESLALGLSSLILLLFGFGKLLSFIFERTTIPEFIEMESPIVSWISNTLGFEAITSVSLIISVVIGFLLIFLVTKVLKEKF